jgi:predicted Zn-dependent protease
LGVSVEFRAVRTNGWANPDKHTNDAATRDARAQCDAWHGPLRNQKENELSADPLEGLRWPAGSTVTWTILTAASEQSIGYNNALPSSYYAIVEAAAAMWQAISGVHLSEVANSPSVDIRIAIQSLDLPLIGETYYNYSSGDTYFTAGVLSYIEDPSVTGVSPVGDGNFVYNGYDSEIFQTVAHEMGHALGLDHNPGDPSALMNPILSTTNRGPNTNDLQAIQGLYGAPSTPLGLTVTPFASSLAGIEVSDFPGSYETITVTASSGSISDPNNPSVSGSSITESGNNLGGHIFAQDVLDRIVYAGPASTLSVTVSNSIGGSAVGTVAFMPASVASGTGPDQLILKVSGDALANGDGTSDAAGDPAFIVTLDGQQLGGTFFAAASHAAGLDQDFVFDGYFGTSPHTVQVTFENDAADGAGGDRNLYIDAVSYLGKDTGQSARLYGTGTQSFSVTGQTPVPTPTPPPTPNPTPTPAPNFTISNQSNGQQSIVAGDAYAGPVPGLTQEIILVTSDNINVTANIPNVFIHTGAGMDAIDVGMVGGNNVLDGSTGSNFLTGGSGADTFYLDDRTPLADVFSTVVGFHSGDNASVFGVNATDFTLRELDGQGAPGFTGLDFAFSAPGRPNANIVLAGFSTADLSNGRLSVSYGTTPDVGGVPGSQYMNIHAN